MFKKIILSLLGIVLLLAAMLLFNTLRQTSKQLGQVKTNKATVDKDLVVNHLGGALRHKTISNNLNQMYDLGKNFTAFHQYLDSIYPNLTAKLTKETFAKYSLLYTWKGKNTALKPVLLLAHQDVVPVDGTSEKDWEFDAFSGTVANGYVLGRGALDDKTSLIGIMEAVEMLVKNGFQPERTIYLAFGHDEEVGGLGAQTIVEALQARKIELEMVVDEGGLISKGSIPGIQQEVALIGTAEKGYCSVELTVKGEGGHSSMPPPQTAVGVLSAAIQRLEANQMPARIAGATRQMLDFIAADAPFFLRLLFSNLWISEPLLRSQFVKSNSGNAALRTTTAATVFNAGIKDNVIPTQAKAVVNFRIIPGETIEDVLAHVKRTINDPRIAVAQSKSQMGQNPSPVSPTDHPSFQTLHQSIREVFPDVLVAPYLVVGATDSRRFIPICKNIYRFMPIRIASEDLKRVHGTNERVKVDCVVESVQFYARLIENLNGLK
ncbi:MAG TPA: hypothetical protein DCM08_11465 [Microscillaceae bacterium]|nr:hypothetical protein [Microscillaceae bacterium]